MTVEQLFTELLQAFPTMANAGKIFFDHVDVQDGDEIGPPYMVVTETAQNPFYADDKTYYLTIRHTIDLYTVVYDAALIDKVEKFLNNNAVPFTVSVEYMDDLNAYISTFEVQLDKTEAEL